MKRLFLIALAFGALPVCGADAQLTRSDNYPFCLLNYGPVSFTECRYTSYAQCQAAASGRGAACFSNPFSQPSEPPAGRRRRH